MNEDNTTLINLTNPEFDIQFEGKTYRVRKATLDKAVAWQNKIKELATDPASNQKILAFCLYIMLKDKIEDLTEEYVLNNIPASIDSMEVMVQLGFLSPSNLEMANLVKENIIKKLTTDSSLQSSPKGQDGLPIK